MILLWTKNLYLIHDSHSPFHRKMHIHLLVHCHPPHLTSCSPTKSNLYFDISFTTVMSKSVPYKLLTWRLIIKFANSPPCVCRGSSGQKSQYGLMMLAYEHFTAVLLLIYGCFFLSGVYYCLSVFWCAVARMSEPELEQRNERTLNFLLHLAREEAKSERC
jgi:hypothetical protein